MNLRIRRISVQLALLLAAAAVAAALAHGFISRAAERGTRQTVIQGNPERRHAPPRRSSPHRDERRLLKALSADLQDTGLSQAQQDRVVKNYVLQVREFREITMFDESGGTIATSRVGHPRAKIPKTAQSTLNVMMSPIRVDEDLFQPPPSPPPRTSTNRPLAGR